MRDGPAGPGEDAPSPREARAVEAARATRAPSRLAERLRTVLLAWALAAAAIWTLLGGWRIGVYAVVLSVGGFLLLGREAPAVAAEMERRGARTLAGFAVLGVTGFVLEELFVVAIGAGLAQPVLWVDLLWTSLIWLAWLLPWYLALGRRTRFSPLEATLVAGTAGIWFEIVVSGTFSTSPLAVLLYLPIVWLAYGAMASLPIALVRFVGRARDARALAIAVVVPILSATGSALVLDLVLRAAGVPLR